MSVLHRIDDLESMDAVRLVTFVEQLIHYQGAVRAAAREELADTAGDAEGEVYSAVVQRPGPTPAATTTTRLPDGREAREVPATREAIARDPVLAGLISFGGG